MKYKNLPAILSARPPNFATAAQYVSLVEQAPALKFHVPAMHPLPQIIGVCLKPSHARLRGRRKVGGVGEVIGRMMQVALAIPNNGSLCN